MDDEEMIRILEEIARSGKSHGARIQAIKEIRELRAAREGITASVEPAKAESDGFDGLYEVANPGRARRAS